MSDYQEVLDAYELTGEMRKLIYIFFREGMFYPLMMREGDAEAIANAQCNPGTLRVEDLDGRVVWRADH